MMFETFAEHLGWCRRRALEYLDAGQMQNATASMLSDLAKDERCDMEVLRQQATLGMRLLLANDIRGLRSWIEDYPT